MQPQMRIRSLPRPAGRGALALIALALALIVGLPAGASAGWTEPARIPGTDGKLGVLGTTLADGTLVALWTEATGAPLTNGLKARVRPAGSTRWRSVDGPAGIYLQGLSISEGDYGTTVIAFEKGDLGSQAVFVTTLDTRTLRFSRPVRVFTDPAYETIGASVARGRDGTLLVGATARPKAPPAGDPVYRAVVAVRRPGAGWVRRYLSAADTFAGVDAVAVNREGGAIVGFIEGYSVAAMTVRAATLPHGRSTRWKIRTVSASGDAQSVSAAIGDDGTAALAWAATSTNFRTARVATTEVDVAASGWALSTVETDSVAIAGAPQVAVTRAGVTSLWARSGRIRGVFIDDTTVTPIAPFTTDGKTAALAGMLARSDGKVAVLYHVYAPGSVNEGLRYRLITAGVPGSETTLTDAADGEVATERLSLARRNRAAVIYTRGTYPSTDFAWLRQQ